MIASTAIDGMRGPSSPSASRCQERLTGTPAASTPSTSTNMPPRCSPQVTWFETKWMTRANGSSDGSNRQRTSPRKRDKATMEQLRHRSRAHPDRFRFGPQHRQGAQVGNVDEREQGVAQWQSSWRRDGEAHLLGEGIADRGLAVASQRRRLASIAGDGADDVLANPGVGRGRNAAPNGIDPRHVRGQAPGHRGRQHGKAGDARQHVDIGGARGGVESLYAVDEGGAVGEVEIVHASGDTGFDHSILAGAIALERAAGVDQHVRLTGGKLRVRDRPRDRKQRAPIEPWRRRAWCRRPSRARAIGRRRSASGEDRFQGVRRCGRRRCRSRR